VGYADQIGTANDIFAEHAWRYRDYVIDAFNADTPYDRFIREQVAGDLLPHESAEQRARQLVATGFLLLGDLPVVEADKAKLRIDVVDQEVDKIGRAFLGMSIGCARCHDHKFDPIPQRDYYALAGILNSTDSIQKAEWGVWSWPTLADLPETEAQQTEREARAEQDRQRVDAEGRPGDRLRAGEGKLTPPGKTQLPQRPSRRGGLSPVQADLTRARASSTARSSTPNSSPRRPRPSRFETSQHRRHEDHHAVMPTRRATCPARVLRSRVEPAPDPAGERAAAGNWPTGSPVPTTP
jgi:hypothetical protein